MLHFLSSQLELDGGAALKHKVADRERKEVFSPDSWSFFMLVIPVNFQRD